MDNSAATPQGISEPARRTGMDDLRRNFETGVAKFRAAGKNLYSLPWYVAGRASPAPARPRPSATATWASRPACRTSSRAPAARST